MTVPAAARAGSPNRRTRQLSGEGGLPAPVRRRRPWLMAVAVLAGLLAWLVVATGLEHASGRVEVWALTAGVSRGHTVEVSQLRPVEVAVSAPAGLIEVAGTRASRLAGRVWAADLPAGTLLSESLTLDGVPVADGLALVGLALEPGGWPTPTLQAGDTVVVFDTSTSEGPVLAETATVETVTVLGDAATATRLVTVTVPIEVAGPVAAAAAATTRPTLVVECPPAGGVFAARWGWPRGGLADLTAHPDADVWGAGRPWLGNTRLLAADPSPATMAACGAAGWLADRLGHTRVDVLVDGGRLRPDDPTLKLLATVGRLWLLLDPTVEQAANAAAWRPLLEGVVSVEVLLARRTRGAADGRYPAGDIATTLGWPVIGEVVSDRRAAAALAGTTNAPGWLLGRLPLVGQAGDLLTHLDTHDPAGVGR